MKRLVFLGLLLAVVVLAIVAFRLDRPPQPSFRGQPASWWFAKAADPTNSWGKQYLWVEPGSASDTAAIAFRQDLDAFQQMGQAAVPFLLQKLRRSRPSSPIYRNIYDQAPPVLGRYLPRPQDAEQQRRTADLILKQLGPKAYRAVPILIRMVKAGDFREELEAINILNTIGFSASNALPPLTAVLGGSDLYLRIVAADAIRHIAPARTEALIAVYREALTNKVSDVHVMAIRSLWEASRKPELVIPALIPLLGDKRYGIFACTMLMPCGQSASNAVPALIAQMEAPGQTLKLAAAVALHSVDPNAEPGKVKQILSDSKAAGIGIGGLPYEAPAD